MVFDYLQYFAHALRIWRTTAFDTAGHTVGQDSSHFSPSLGTRAGELPCGSHKARKLPADGGSIDIRLRKEKKREQCDVWPADPRRHLVEMSRRNRAGTIFVPPKQDESEELGLAALSIAVKKRKVPQKKARWLAPQLQLRIKLWPESQQGMAPDARCVL